MANIIELKSDKPTDLEAYIKDYIEKNEIVATRFPDETIRQSNVPISLNIAALFESIRMSSVSTKKRTAVTEHFEVFTYIMRELEEAGVDFTISNIFSTTKDIQHLSESQMKTLGLNLDDPGANYVSKVIGRIDINDCMSDKRNLSIGIGYDDKGISLCYGTNITACSNMSLFGDNFRTTKGKNGLDIDSILEHVKRFIIERKIIWDENNAVLDGMQDTIVDPKIYFNFYGYIEHMATGKAYYGQKWMFTKAKASEFDKKLWEHFKEKDEESITLYDLYNIGTNVLTHQTNIDLVWKDLQDFGEFIKKYFNL